MKTISRLFTLFLFCIVVSSCTKDLDTLPLDDNELVADKLYADAANYKGVLAKCYGALALTGQQGGDGGDNDLGSFNEGYGGYTRILFYLQDLTTDEVLMPSSTNGLRECLTMSWTPNTAVIQGAYTRLYLTIGYCNEFLRQTTPEKLEARGVANAAEIKNNLADYRNEARFIRAYCYSVLGDLFGDIPFATEELGVGTMPHQKSRKEVFAYVESELLDLATTLKDPHANEFARVDKAAAWFLLARIYLNAEVYTGLSQYANAYKYAKQVIDANFPLAKEYRNNFLADNHTSTEIIWPLVQDGLNGQSSAGTNFFVKAFVNGNMQSYFDTGIGTKGWGNVRVKPQFVDKFDVADQTFNTADVWGNTKKDKRAQFFTIGHNKQTATATGSFSTLFTDGYALIKWRNVKADGGAASDGTYVDVDFPLFRSADSYLMAAEAILRGGGGTKAEALANVNEVRNRAYQSGAYGTDLSGAITESELTLDFLLDERAREFSTELVRRTDLIRFGKFVKNNNWAWKGNVLNGKDMDDKYVLFPLPASDISANPNLVQNPNY
ncbi:RagB/SusD family nutrient uptake outer membrane protein [Pedobacter sp. AW31-3R]|uniref:RagB/SusD family nutrient uptake outer membrane protein n=1 Tax=Pedobacter sp. AW31-3R TaxID=3445781 RepID=UPI003F9FFDE4